MKVEVRVIAVKEKHKLPLIKIVINDKLISNSYGDISLDLFREALNESGVHLNKIGGDLSSFSRGESDIHYFLRDGVKGIVSPVSKLDFDEEGEASILDSCQKKTNTMFENLAELIEEIKLADSQSEEFSIEKVQVI